MTRRTLAAVFVAVVMTLVGSVSAQRGPGSPMRIVLLVDSSMAVSQMINPFRSALKSFLDALQGDPEIVFVTTGGQLRLREGPTTDRAKVMAAAARFAPDGGGNTFVDTLLEADRRFLKSAPERRSIFVIMTTDLDSTSTMRTDLYNRFMNDFIRRGGRAHAVIITGVSGGMTTQIAQNLVQNSGGYIETIAIATALPKVMKTVADYVAADQ